MTSDMAVDNHIEHQVQHRIIPCTVRYYISNESQKIRLMAHDVVLDSSD